MPAALATTEDLTALLGRPVDIEEMARADRLLEMVSAAVRSECRQTFSYVASDPVRLYPSTGEVWLPERPVVAVTSVSVPGTLSAAVGSGTPLLPSAYLFRSDGFLGAFQTDWPVDVVYSHGFQVIPADLVGVVCAIAARHMSNPEQVARRKIGPFEEQYAARPVGTVLAAEEKAALTVYRRTAWSPRAGAR